MPGLFGDPWTPKKVVEPNLLRTPGAPENDQDLSSDEALIAYINSVAAGLQPHDADLDAIAALATTSFGRALLTLVDAAAMRVVAGLVIGTDVQAYDLDLANIAALTTTSYGRSLLVQADAAALRSTAGLVIGTDVQAFDSDLNSIAALTTTSFGRSLLTQADATALRSTAGLVIGTDVQAFDADLAAIAALATTSFGRSLLTQADAAATRATIGALVDGGNLQQFGDQTATAEIRVNAGAANVALLTLRRGGLSTDQAQISWNGTNLIAAAVAGGGIELRGDTIAFRSSTAVATRAQITSAGLFLGTGTAASAQVLPAGTELAPYRTIIEPSGSHTAGRVAGTYGFGHGDPLAIDGTGILYPLDVVYLDPADFPAVGSLAAKLRLRCTLNVNDVAPTGNYVVGLHPVSRPATSGGAGLDIYTIGAAVSGSTITFTAPAADSQNNGVGADFAFPAAGHYIIGMVSSAAVAASSHLHFSAMLQLHYA